jgi:hypothetical protein
MDPRSPLNFPSGGAAVRLRTNHSYMLFFFLSSFFILLPLELLLSFMVLMMLGAWPW